MWGSKGIMPLAVGVGEAEPPQVNQRFPQFTTQLPCAVAPAKALGQLTTMPTQPQSPTHRAKLTRRDLLAFEQRLLGMLRQFISFRSHSVLFPREHSHQQPVWLDEEQKILLPLPAVEGGTLGVFLARGVEQRGAASLVEQWPNLAPLMLENLLLYKQSLCDQATGLYSRHYLMQRLCAGIESLREGASGPARTEVLTETQQEARPMAKGQKQASAASQGHSTPPEATQPHNAKAPAQGTGKEQATPPLPPEPGLLRTENLGTAFTAQGCLGIITVRFSALRDVVREFGYQFADSLVVEMADALQASVPEQALATRTGDMEFAVLLPATTQKSCRKLSVSLAESLRKVTIEHPLRRNRVGLATSIGYALFPQDSDASHALRTPHDQAAILLRQARLAAALADEQGSHGSAPEQGERIMGFSRILAEGGRVREILPLSRAVVSLGSNMHAREGMRFSVWSTNYPVQGERSASPLPPLYKGELVLMQVQENASLAEIIHVGDASWQVAPGDLLRLSQDQQYSRADNAILGPDPVTGLLRHADFLAAYSKQREACREFGLVLLRVTPYPQVEEAGEAALWQNPEELMAEVTRLCQEALGPALGGRYGLTSLLHFHPHATPEALEPLYKALSETLQKRLPVSTATGIAHFPFLEYRKADTLDNCQKVLEYALLLPEPHVGVLDSLALNVNADRLYSQGNIFGAIQEYQNALLADECNSMAWNSLGICLASIGRHCEAEHHFTRALQHAPEEPMTLYNLAFVRQLQGDVEEAVNLYVRCLNKDPGHLYALIRLGQIAENNGDFYQARALYEAAAAQPEGTGITRRHFARLCMAEGNPDEAREHLHEALLANPQDAFAMQLLAGLYLDAGEDPDLAASFARQSVSLRPELKTGWLELARALEALGCLPEAREAELQAQRL